MESREVRLARSGGQNQEGGRHSGRREGSKAPSLLMKLEYGDYLYLAYNCNALKGNDMEDMRWKIEKLDWQEVAEKIKKEENTLAEESARRLPLSKTPYLDSVKEAATRLGYDTGLVRYQIIAYAECNNFCHNGIKDLINHAEFAELAEKLVEDKRALGEIYRGNPRAQIEMRSVLKIIENEWFDSIWIDNTRKVPVKFSLSDKAQDKWKKVAAAHKAKQAGH